MLSLYHYFKPIQKVPDPNGPLSSLVPTPIIQQANIEVLNIVEKTTQGNGGKRKPYKKISDSYITIQDRKNMLWKMATQQLQGNLAKNLIVL